MFTKYKVAKLLYVEDEKGIQEEMLDVLSDFCTELLVADDGFQGLKLFQEHEPQIVISDIRMPVMNGIEMCQKIKDIAPTTHILFTTAFSDTDFFLDAIELQVDGYILKPIKLNFLENKLNEIAHIIHTQEELRIKEKMLIRTSKLASMGEMIGNIAHQWKQPLSSITAQLANLKVDAQLDNLTSQNAQDYAENIEQQILYLSKTIDDFRTFFTPDKLNASYNIKQFLDKCIDLVSSSFGQNMIETIKDIDEKVNTHGDPNKLVQAIINLLNNSKDALNDVEGLRQKLVFILTLKETASNQLEIIIKDNAGGIPENIINQVFDAYFTTKHKRGGTGLGLYISKNIITDHLNGSIRVENDVFEHQGVEYKGAKFTINLPLKST